MWYRAESGDANKPKTLETNLSKKYNYIRKDFEFVKEERSGAEIIRPAHWTWLEQKILKADWETYLKVINHDTAIEDLENGLIEIAELIVG